MQFQRSCKELILFKVKQKKKLFPAACITLIAKGLNGLKSDEMEI